MINNDNNGLFEVISSCFYHKIPSSNISLTQDECKLSANNSLLWLDFGP